MGWSAKSETELLNYGVRKGELKEPLSLTCMSEDATPKMSNTTKKRT